MRSCSPETLILWWTGALATVAFGGVVTMLGGFTALTAYVFGCGSVFVWIIAAYKADTETAPEPGNPESCTPTDVTEHHG